MIRPSDFRFHPSDPQDITWTETLFIIFSVPEAGISGSIYTLARPNLGVCHSSIDVHRGFCLEPWKVHHNDAQMHLACPPDFSDFQLSNGLRFKAHDERRCQFDYTSLDGNCALEIEYEAVCDPFDMHDPTHNPLMITAPVADYHGWNNGHMESKGLITGSVRLGDKTYRVNCIDGMNKSWGVRRDWGNKGAAWVHIDLGEGLNAFMVLALRFENKEVVYGPLNFGFVVVDGERRPLVKATMRGERSSMLIMRADVTFEDDRGDSYQAVGTTIAAAPWYTFNPSSVAFQSLLRWESGSRVGYSHIGDFSGLGNLSQGMADA